MRRLFSNLVVISLGLLGAIAKWGGLVMDVIGLPEAGSQLDNWISQLEIGDGAYILIVVSVILLLIINGPALRRAFLKPKARTYGIEEIREFSGILSPRNEVGRQGWNKVEMGTFHIGQNEEETLQPVTTNQDPLEVDLRWWPKDKVFCEYTRKNWVRCKRASDTARHENIEIRYEIWTKQNGAR